MAKVHPWKTLGFGVMAAASLAYSPGASAKTLGFVLTEFHHAGQYTSDLKLECPQGLSPGLRDNFRAVFKTKEEQEARIMKYLSVEMRARGPNGESETYLPELTEDPLPFYEAQGKISHGFNLDGTKDGRDTNLTCHHGKFTSPDGETGIDNQLYRSMGCTKGLRLGGQSDAITNSKMVAQLINRWLVEITGVDDEANDEHVEITLGHGLDKIVKDPAGNFVPGLSQRLDEKATGFIFHTTGKIVNGVLVTDEISKLELGQTPDFGEVGVRPFLTAHLQMKLGADQATGILGGYHDVERYYRFWAKTTGQHSVTADMSAPSYYRSLHRNADGYKDPKTGQCTAISAAYDVKFVRAFIVRETPENQISDNELSGQQSAGLARYN